MRLNREEAEALGLGDLWPDDRPPSQAPPPDGLTKLERRFRDTVLAPALGGGGLVAYWREPMKLRLAGRTFYTPDWLVATPARGGAVGVGFVETKGYMREDANVKIKTAAYLYPYFGWLLVYRDRRAGWLAYEVTSRGIGVNSIIIPWIHGGTPCSS